MDDSGFEVMLQSLFSPPDGIFVGVSISLATPRRSFCMPAAKCAQGHFFKSTAHLSITPLSNTHLFRRKSAPVCATEAAGWSLLSMRSRVGGE